MKRPHKPRVMDARRPFALAAVVWVLNGGAALSASEPPPGQEFESSFEGLFSPDIQLTASSAGYRFKQGRFGVDVGVTYNTHQLRYAPAPFDFLGSTRSLSARQTAGSLGGTITLSPSLTLSGDGALREGYSEYRSVWLNEYYRQQFSSVSGFGDHYVTPAPRGESAGTGLRWEYLPAAGFVQAEVHFSHDRIAPGYEIDFAGLRAGRPNLYTHSFGLSFENVLSRRVRLLNEFRATETTLRERRYAYSGSLNVAVGEHWVIRALGGYTSEAPAFEARYFGGTVELEVGTGWFLSGFGRSYSDSGEIENSLFSSAAPALSSWQSGLGLRRTWGVHTLKLSAGPYFTRYAAAGIGTAFFQNLYRSRNWAVVQLAYSADF